MELSQGVKVAGAAVLAGGALAAAYHFCLRDWLFPSAASSSVAPSGTTVPSSAAAVAAVASGSAADFEAAVEFSKNAATLKKLPLGTKLELYALYKQGNLGPCKDPSPALWDFEKREKWKAWSALGDLPVEDARRRYVGLVATLVPDWKAAASTAAPAAPAKASSSSRDDITEDDDSSSGVNPERDMFRHFPVSTLNHGNPDAARVEDVFQWAQDGNLVRVHEAVEAGFDLKAVNENGETALHVAADAGRLEVVQFLLERGADANAQEPDQGQTPLTYAIMAEHADVAEALVRGGADPLQSDKEGSNPLAECGDEELHARLQSVFEEVHGEHQGAGEAKAEEA